METDKKLETKEKIMRATLELTKQEGFERITIKKIAEASSTNVALVNYYFGSKENLFSESIKLILNSFQHTFAILDDFSISSRDRLRQFLLDYLQVIRQYPELLSRIILMGNTVFSSQHEYGSFLNLLGFPKIQNTLRELTDEQQPEHLMTMTMQILERFFYRHL